MSDIQLTADAIGIKVASVVAGFAGGVVSLSYVRVLTKAQAVLAVLTGAICASYLTPIAQYHLNLGPALENGVAFAIGLCAMNIVPGMLRLSEVFRNDPAGFLRRKGGDE